MHTGMGMSKSNLFCFIESFDSFPFMILFSFSQPFNCDMAIQFEIWMFVLLLYDYILILMAIEKEVYIALKGKIDRRRGGRTNGFESKDYRFELQQQDKVT